MITPPRAPSSAGVAPDIPLDTTYYVKNNPYQKPTRVNEQLKMIVGKRAHRRTALRAGSHS